MLVLQARLKLRPKLLFCVEGRAVFTGKWFWQAENEVSTIETNTSQWMLKMKRISSNFEKDVSSILKCSFLCWFCRRGWNCVQNCSFVSKAERYSLESDFEKRKTKFRRLKPTRHSEIWKWNDFHRISKNKSVRFQNALFCAGSAGAAEVASKTALLYRM